MNKVKAKLVISLVVVCWSVFMTGCANWQGAEFRIGIGSYNGASETKTYTKTGVNK